MEEAHTVIAIDGPSGAGKGTVARAVAAKLGYQHVDTGAMYRAVAWKASLEKVAFDDEAGLSKLTERVTFGFEDGRTFIDGDDVTEAIRTPEIDIAAAAVAKLPDVRRALVARQRALGESGGLVMEGRDIGTVVFPNATVKIYLDATADERARRRAADPAHASGRSHDLAFVATALATRDELDRTRAASPLKLAEDADFVDTTGVPVEQVVQRVLTLVHAKLGGSDSEES